MALARASVVTRRIKSDGRARHRLLLVVVLAMEGSGGAVADAQTPSMVSVAFAVQHDGSYRSAEAHVHLFEDWHRQLTGAKLKTVETFVLDKDRREGHAHITCMPRHGVGAQPNKQRQRRALNDVKQLNDAGLMALRREKRGGLGLLSKTCVVWRIVRQCTGTTLCDPSTTRRGCHCAVTVEYSATVEDVHQQQVRIKLAGVQAVATASLHSVSKQWDPAHLQAQHMAQFPSRCERVKRAAESVHGLQTQLVGSEQRLATEDDDSAYNDLNDAESTVADWRAEAQATKRLRLEIGEAQRELHEAQRDVRTTLTAAQRTEVFRLMRDGHSALTIQSMLAPTPTSAPPLEAIQYTMDNERRRTRCGLEAYESVHWMCRDLLVSQQRVMLYLVNDPVVNPDNYTDGSALPFGALHLVMCATIAMIDTLCMATGIGVDTKWRTREDKGCVQAIVAFAEQCVVGPTEGHRAEFSAGYRGQQSSVVAISLANLDNYWTLKVQLDALRGLMPCSNPNCTHPLRRVDLDQRGSFVMQRACRMFKRRPVWWKDFDPRQRFPPRLSGMIDKASYEARALRNSGITVLLCSFHVYAAILEWLDKQLRLKIAQTVFMLIIMMKFIARGRTDADVDERWTVVRTALFKIQLTEEQRAKIIEYIEKQWLCETWKHAWTDIGRSRDDIDDSTTNNSVERLWIHYVDVVCQHKQFKRVDLELNAITGALNTLSTNLLDVLELSRRDAVSKRTRIANDVHLRLLLALTIVIQGGVVPFDRVPGIFFVKRGISPWRFVSFGSHSPQSNETRVPEMHVDVARVLQRLMWSRLETRGIPASQKHMFEGFYCVDIIGRTCTCWDFVYRGSERGGCKHMMSARLRLHYGAESAREASIHDFASALRSRELRVPTEVQVKELRSSSDHSIWQYIYRNATRSDEEVESDLLPEMEEREEEQSLLGSVSKKSKPQRAKQPPSAFLLYSVAQRSKIQEELASRAQATLGFAELSKEVGRRWQLLQPRQRAIWEGRAAVVAAQVDSSRVIVATTNEEDNASLRAGPPKGMDSKARHRWRSCVDTMRPIAGLKNRDLQSRPGGISSRMRVDAAADGRDSRLVRMGRPETTKKAKAKAKQVS